LVGFFYELKISRILQPSLPINSAMVKNKNLMGFH